MVRLCWWRVQRLERGEVGGQVWQDELGEALGLLQVLEAVRAQVAQRHAFRQVVLDQGARRLARGAPARRAQRRRCARPDGHPSPT